MTKVQKERQVYKVEEDGTSVLISTETIEIETPSQEELIADKEAQLLAMYNELQKLKDNS